MYRIRILKAASRELARLDKPAGKRIAERIHWLAANLHQIKPQSLAGELSGLSKLRVGDYRVIYQILHDEHTIVIHSIGPRRDIYRRR